MEYISINAAIAFTFYAIFLFYQNMHLRTIAAMKNFLYYALWTSTLLGAAVGAFWLYYYASHVIFYAPFLILIAAIVIILFASSLEKIIPVGMISLAGFVGWPIAAYYMFLYIPPAPFLPVQPSEDSMLLIRLLVG